MRALRALQDALSRIVHAHGCVRILGLMRIATALMVWARFADRFRFDPEMTAVDAGIAVAFYTSTFLMAVGQFSRSSTAVAAAVLLYGYHYRGVYLGAEGWTSNNMHLLDLTVAVLALAPCGRTYSLDRWWALRRAESLALPPPDEEAPLWSSRLLAVLLSSVYLSTFLSKTNWPFLSGERLAAVFASHYTGSNHLGGAAWEGLMQGGAIAVWCLEGLLVIGLSSPRLRGSLMVAGSLMHLGFYALFRVFAFSTNMMMLYLAYVPASAVRRVIDEQCGHGEATRLEAPPARPTSTTLSLRLCVIGAVLVGASVLGVAQLREPAPTELDGRLPALILMQPRLERGADPNSRRDSDHAWQRREMQRWGIGR